MTVSPLDANSFLALMTSLLSTSYICGE